MGPEGFGIEDFIKTAVDCKMEGIDWVTTCENDPKDLKNMSHDAGLEIACHTFFLYKFLAGEKKWLDEVKQSIENAVILGAPIIMIPTCKNPNMKRSLFRDFWIDGLKKIAPLVNDAGLILTIENFPGKSSAFVTADDYFKAKAEIPSLKLTYDDGNATSGEEPIESFKRCANDVVHVHFKDWYISDTPKEGHKEMLNGKYFKPALIGQGDIDTASVWNALKNHGYKGFINVEYESNAIKTDKAIKLAVEYLHSL